MPHCLIGLSCLAGVLTALAGPVAAQQIAEGQFVIDRPAEVVIASTGQPALYRICVAAPSGGGAVEILAVDPTSRQQINVLIRSENCSDLGIASKLAVTYSPTSPHARITGTYQFIQYLLRRSVPPPADTNVLPR